MRASSPVLVIDDDPGTREALGVALATHGYRAVLAEDGEEGLARLRSDLAPGLILLDIVMPRMDGRGFRSEQLRDPSLAAIPVVIMSAELPINREAAVLGVEGALQKPIDLDDLMTLVARYYRS